MKNFGRSTCWWYPSHVAPDRCRKLLRSLVKASSIKGNGCESRNCCCIALFGVMYHVLFSSPYNEGLQLKNSRRFLLTAGARVGFELDNNNKLCISVSVFRVREGSKSVLDMSCSLSYERTSQLLVSLAAVLQSPCSCWQLRSL